MTVKVKIPAFPIKNINNFSYFFFLLFNRVHLMIRSTNDFWPIITNWTFTLLQSPISKFWIIWIWSVHETFRTDHVITANINMKLPLILISLKICLRRLMRWKEALLWHDGDKWLMTEYWWQNLENLSPTSKSHQKSHPCASVFKSRSCFTI